MAYIKKFLNLISDFSLMALFGIFMGTWIFFQQTPNLSFFKILTRPLLYGAVLALVFIYRLFLWISVDNAFPTAFHKIWKQSIIDYIRFILLMLCTTSTLFLASILF